MPRSREKEHRNWIGKRAKKEKLCSIYRTAIDVGLNPLFATDKGDLIGRLETLKAFEITKRMSYLQKQGIKPKTDEKYRKIQKDTESM